MNEYPWPPESTAAEIIQWMRGNGAEACVVAVSLCDGMRLGYVLGSLSGMIAHGGYEAPAICLLGIVSAASMLIPRRWLLEATYSLYERWRR